MKGIAGDLPHWEGTLNSRDDTPEELWRAMRNTIAVMNTKGGVGKSTLVLAMAETLSAKFAKNVLVIDADAQASVSLMLVSPGTLHQLQLDGLTIVDLLVASVLNNVAVDWASFVVADVSDVQESRTVYLIPSDMQLTLLEREVSRDRQLVRLRDSVRALLGCVREMFDIILIDCPPGLSVLTESLLREADFHIPPIIPDHTSIYALEVLGHFKGLNPEMGFADNLGVLINMSEMQSSVDAEHQRRLMGNAGNRCFEQAIPRTKTLQHVSQFSPVERSYGTKYPGEAGNALQNLCQQLIDRLAAANTMSHSVALNDGGPIRSSSRQ